MLTSIQLDGWVFLMGTADWLLRIQKVELFFNYLKYSLKNFYVAKNRKIYQ